MGRRPGGRELSLLVTRAPRVAALHSDGGVAEVPVERVRVGDRVLVRAGEIVPTDGVVDAEVAVLDEAALRSAGS